MSEIKLLHPRTEVTDLDLLRNLPVVELRFIHDLEIFYSPRYWCIVTVKKADVTYTKVLVTTDAFIEVEELINLRRPDVIRDRVQSARRRWKGNL